MPMCVVHLRLRRMLILDFCGQTHKQKDNNGSSETLSSFKFISKQFLKRFLIIRRVS